MSNIIDDLNDIVNYMSKCSTELSNGYSNSLQIANKIKNEKVEMIRGMIDSLNTYIMGTIDNEISTNSEISQERDSLDVIKNILGELSNEN